MPSFRWVTPVLGAALVIACAGRPLPPDQITAPGQLLFNGRVRPSVNCFKCHDGDASGTGRGPDLGKEAPHMSDEQIIRAIDRGPGLMPSFEDELSTAEKQEIAAWLRQRFPSGSAR